MTKAKYILFAWAWPIFSILLFVCAMCLLIHEAAFHNGAREQKLYAALGLVVITFVNGMVAVLLSGHYKKPQTDKPLPKIKVKYMKHGSCNDCGCPIKHNDYWCDICIKKDCDQHEDSLDCENSNEKRC
jgi:hypothetical protein